MDPKAGDGEPVLLLHRGLMLDAALQKTRMSEEEVRIVLRSAGLSTVNQAEAVVLETDGTMTVVTSDSQPGDSTLEGVRRI